MKYLILIVLAATMIPASSQTLSLDDFSRFPQTTIGNDRVTMTLMLPDPEKGSYRATRFEWSGIIASLTYDGHEFFGYWKKTHDPLVHEDLSGPVESSTSPGLGYEEAEAGGQFVRLGVGIIEKPDNQPYETFKTYEITDHGVWDVNKGPDWIEFKHEIESDIGYGYTYIKRITLKKDEPGFKITHILKNTGNKSITTDQYNHNFFIIDGEASGPNILTSFPFPISTENDLKGFMEISGRELHFVKDLAGGNSVWMELKGYSKSINDHQVTIRNNKSGAGVRYHVDKPLHKMVFWACETTYCPENFIYIDLKPGQTDTWISDYTLFTD